MNVKTLRRRVGFYPPFLGAGIKVKYIAPDVRRIDVEMPLRFWNRNLVGTHFRGSLYAMTDLFFMMMLIQNLGPDYIVWDKSAGIRFRRPGTGTVHARFELTQERLDEIRTLADRQEKVEPVFQVQVVDAKGNVVAEIEKVLYVRRKPAVTPEPR